MPVPFTFNQGEVFVQALSDFWKVAFEDVHFAKVFMKAYGDCISDAYFNFLESVLGTNLKSLPAFRKQKWTFLTLKLSDMNEEGKLEYGQDAEYGPQANSPFTEGREFLYDDEIPATYSFNLPENMVDIETYIFNRIHNPSLSFVKRKHFSISRGVITFVENPFSNPLVPVRVIYDETGNEVDREAGLWALNSSWDYDELWKLYGSKIGYKKTSSVEYKNFLEAIWALHVTGASYRIFEGALNAAFNLPVSRDDEILNEIVYKSDVTLVLTDKNSYQLSSALPINEEFIEVGGKPKVGHVLKPYTPLTNCLKIYSKSTPNWWRQIDPIVIPSRLMRSPFPEFKLGDSWTLRLQPQVIYELTASASNSVITNAINLDVNYLGKPFSQDEFVIVTVTKAGSLGDAELTIQLVNANTTKVVTTKTSDTYLDLEEEVNLPFRLEFDLPTSEELTKDFVVPNRDIKGHNILGGVYGLSVEDNPPNEFFLNMGVKIGSFPIGKGNGTLPKTFWINSKEYIMGNFFQHNMFYLQIHEAAISSGILTDIDVKIIRETIPAHIIFIALINLPAITTSIYDIESQAEDALDIDKGVPTDKLNDIAYYAKPELDYSYVYGGVGTQPCSSIVIHPLNAIITTALNHRVTVTTGGVTATLTITNSAGSTVATVNVTASQRYYVVSSLDIVIEVVPSNNGFCLGDYWTVEATAYDDSANLGYIDGCYGSPLIGFVGIGTDFTPSWTIGGSNAFFPSLQVRSRCQAN